MDIITLLIGGAGGTVFGIILSSVFGFTWSKAMGIFAKKVPVIAPAVKAVEADVAGLAKPKS